MDAIGRAISVLSDRRIVVCHHRVVLLLVALALLGGCATSRSLTTRPGKASAEGAVRHWRTYENPFFGFSMQVPRDWHSADSAFMQAYRASGVDVIAGDRADLALVIAERNPRAVLLVTAMRFPVGTLTEQFNDNIACIAFKVSDVATVKTGADYLEIVTGGDKERVSEIRPMSIAGRDFYARAIIRSDKPGVTQEVAATVDQGYAFTCTLTYATGSKGDAVHHALDTIRITR